MRQWTSHLWYESVYCSAHLACTLGLSLRTTGRAHVPTCGPVLLIANHQSFLDPVLVGLATRRHLSYLARKSLFRHPLFRSLIGSLNAVPIDQDSVGKEGLKVVLNQLQIGRAVLVFPEGTRTEDGTMSDFRPGIHLLIRRTDCQIVPVGIAGAYETWPVWRPYPIPSPLFLPATDRTVAVSVGTPVPSAQYRELARQDVLHDLLKRVRAEKDKAERLRRK
jgi:1-acyl-sn-glycerol-3-phosphate acyltransferase